MKHPVRTKRRDEDPKDKEERRFGMEKAKEKENVFFYIVVD